MRRVPRLPVQLEATLESEGGKIKQTITDLGLKGAFVTLPPKAEIGPLVTMRFRPPQDHQDLEVLARMVRRTEEGAGFEFLDLDQEELQHLWSSLVPLWPSELHDCPYCGQLLTGKRRKECHLCHLPLDFQHEDYLEKLPDDSPAPKEMIGTCPSMHRVFHLIRKVATTDVPILVTGASGTGKEMVARAIHQRSNRAQGPFVAVNCGAIPRELLESELFGHERGSFTGAFRTVVGKVELAHGGTLFLDEVGELPLELQVKLLRFLQEYAFERVGGRQQIQVDLRVVSATNRDLREAISENRFRDDLYYRLNGITIELPELKDRGEDVLIMANVFMRRYANKIGKEVSGFTQETTRILQEYPWPGNIRELANFIRRAVVMSDTPWIAPESLGIEPEVIRIHPGNGNGKGNSKDIGLKEAKAQFEARLVTDALASYRGNVQQAARALKTSRSVIYHLINKYQLKDYVEVYN